MAYQCPSCKGTNTAISASPTGNRRWIQVTCKSCGNVWEMPSKVK